MGQAVPNSESRGRELYVRGRGTFVLRNLAWEDDLRLHRRLREWPRQQNAKRQVNEFISMAVVRPTLTAKEVDALPLAVRRRLRLAALDMVGAATDYRRLGGSFLSADERAFAALEWRRRRQVANHAAIIQRIRERRDRLVATAPRVSLKAQRLAERQLGRNLKGIGLFDARNTLKVLTGGLGASLTNSIGVHGVFDPSPHTDRSRYLGGIGDIGRRGLTPGITRRGGTIRGVGLSSDFQRTLAMGSTDRLRQQVLGVSRPQDLQRTVLGIRSAEVRQMVTGMPPSDEIRRTILGIAPKTAFGGSMFPPALSPKSMALLTSYGSLDGFGSRMLRDQNVGGRAFRSGHLREMPPIGLRAVALPNLNDLIAGRFDPDLASADHTSRYRDTEFDTLDEEFNDEVELDEPFWLMAWLIGLRTQGGQLAERARVRGSDILDSSGQWAWEYPLYPVSAYSEVAPHLSPLGRKLYLGAFGTSALGVASAVATSWNGVGIVEGFLWAQTWLTSQMSYWALADKQQEIRQQRP